MHQNYSCTNWKGYEPECLIRLPGHFSDLSSPAASALNLCLAPFNHQKQEQMVVEQTTRGNGIFHRCAMRVYISMYIYCDFPTCSPPLVRSVWTNFMPTIGIGSGSRFGRGWKRVHALTRVLVTGSLGFGTGVAA